MKKNPLYNSCILHFIILNRIKEFLEITVNQDILKYAFRMIFKLAKKILYSQK